MKRIFTIAFAFALALGGAAAVNADPGPNGNNNHGLCTAYFNGQKKGHDGDNNPPPFKALEEAADAANGDGDGAGTAQEVYDFCMDLVGGNPDHGRYPSCFDDGNCDN